MPPPPECPAARGLSSAPLDFSLRGFRNCAVTRLRRTLSAALVVIAIVTIRGVAGAATATVDANGNLVVDGAPFFPIGIYHVSWIGDRQGDEAIPDLQQAADAGFNLFHPTLDARDSIGALLDVAAARGVYVIGEIPWPPAGPAPFVDKWKAKPALIAWNVADDFNAPYAGPAYNHPPAQVTARSATIHGLAPMHLSYASGGSYPGYRIADFAGTMDLMAFQSYPIGAQNHPDDYALQENVDSFEWVRDELAGTGQTFIANPQAYRWDDGGRYPTAREARNLLYAPLIFGAKGVVWYTMWEGGGTLLPSVAPALWQELARLNVELRSLTPFLLHGTRSELATGDPRVRAAAWRLAGQELVVVLGTHRTGAVPISLPLGVGAEPPAHVLFPGRAEGGMTVTGGALVGSVGAEEVHVYLIDDAVAGDGPPVPSFTANPPGAAFAEPITLDATGSTDPDGSVASFAWDLGDGTLASGAVVAHTWARPGTYAVRLTVWDDDGAPATTIVPLAVGITSRCSAAPRSGCRSGGATKLGIRDGDTPSRRKLDWSWKKATTPLAELGDPTTTTEYALCIYDGDGLAVATGVRPGSRWQALGAKGFRLRNPSGDPGGLVKAGLKPSASNASLAVQGKGSHLPVLGLPLVAPVTAQLVAGSVCWEGVYAPGPRTVSTASSFKARAP